MENDRARQMVAAVVGILIIVALVLIARWTGDRIRERFLTPAKPVVVTNQPVMPVRPVQPMTPVAGVATVSAIPSTGPADFGYFAITLMFLSGISFSVLARTNVRRL